MSAIGVDVSSWQGAINWSTLATKANFCFMRATLGSFGTDSRALVNWNNAARTGLMIAPYHLWYPNISPEAQAQHFIGFINEVAGDRMDLPPAVDVEIVRDIPASVNAARIKTFLEIVEAQTGWKPVIYTAAWYWNPYVGNTSWAKDYDLWVAHYTTALTPRLPYGWSTWAFWQYSAGGNGRGYEYGVQSRDIDINRFNGNLLDLRHRYSRKSTSPEEYLKTVAREAHTILLNTDAALMSAMTTDGFVPVSNEHWETFSGKQYIYQIGQSNSGPSRRIYWVENGDFANINKINL